MLRRLLIFLAALALAAQDNLRGTFERARLLEERNTNLPEAVRLYGEVADKGKGQRLLAARARYQQGVLLARLGRRAEALAAWRAVINDFPEQTELVRLARLRLNPSGPPPPSTVQRRLGEGDQFSSPSPDGRSLAHVDWTSGNLALLDLRTGERRPLTRNGNADSPSSATALSPLFSPDGRFIAYNWWGVNEAPSLRIIGVDGSGDRQLFADPLLRESEPLAWSSDGSKILVKSMSAERTTWLSVIPTAGGAPRRLTAPAGRALGHAVFDLDNTGVIATVQSAAGAADIVYIDPRGNERPLVSHPAHDFLIGWAPGNQLLFGSDRLGVTSIWALRPVNGVWPAEPSLIKQEISLHAPLGITRAGALFYAVTSGIVDVYTATLNPPSPPRALVAGIAGANSLPSWSPDGRRLLYFSRRNPRQGHPVVYDPATGRAAPVAADLAYVFRPQWTPDGTAIFAYGIDPAGRRGHFRIDPATGRSSLVFPIELTDTGFEGAWSANGRYYFNRHADWRKGIYRIDAATAQRTSLYVPPAGVSIGKENLTPSPDGEWLAFHATGPRPGASSLMLMPAAGGPARALLTIQSPSQFSFAAFAWLPDSRSILAAYGPPGQHEVWRVPLEGTPPVATGIRRPHIANIRLHRDGNTLAFHSGQPDSEIWVLENFLPANEKR